MVETYTYGTYGELLSGDATLTRFLYNGKLGVSTDDNGLFYMRQRYYNPEIKRFVNQDILAGSLDNSQSLNRYCYVQGNPVSYTDPFGLSPMSGQSGTNFIRQWYELLSGMPKSLSISMLGRVMNALNCRDYGMVALSEIMLNVLPTCIATDAQGEWEILENISNAVSFSKNKWDGFKQSIVDWAEGKKQSNKDGTFSVKISANATLLLGAYVDIGVSGDWKGNISVQWSYSVPGVDETVTVGVADIGAAIAVAYTDATDVDGLLGASTSVGASGGYLGYLAVDAISFDDASDLNSDLNGWQIGVGVGAGIDIHIAETYTHEIYQFNQYDWIIDWFK